MKSYSVKYFGVVAMLAALATGSFAQKLDSTAPNGLMLADEINARITKVFGKYAPAQAKTNINLTKIVYSSTDEDGKPVTLTGLVAMPRGGAPNGLVVYCHGTIQDRKASPSRYRGEENGSEPESAILAFATGGYAVVMPDYLGLGDHKAAHPYPLNIVNAQSAVDIIAPARRLARNKNYNIGSKLYVTGYSEGGGIAMAATQKLERMTGVEYRVEASAPASGPYDLSGAERNFFLAQPTTQVGFVMRLYLLSYSSYYFRKHSNIKITDYFKPAMANSIWLNYNAGLSDEDLIKRLGLTSVLMRSKNSIFNVITPRFKRALETTDKRDPFVAELARNDIYDWAPNTTMLLINLDGDAIVPPENTENAVRAMRKRGVTAQTMRRYVIRDTSLNHITAVPAAMATVRKFFDRGFGAVVDEQ